MFVVPLLVIGFPTGPWTVLSSCHWDHRPGQVAPSVGRFRLSRPHRVVLPVSHAVGVDGVFATRADGRGSPELEVEARWARIHPFVPRDADRA